MSYKDIIKKIKEEERTVISDKLIDVLLEAKEGAAVPSYLAKRILSEWHKDQLSSENGIALLLEAAFKADEERSKSILTEIGGC